jgi:hypothetical protein
MSETLTGLSMRLTKSEVIGRFIIERECVSTNDLGAAGTSKRQQTWVTIAADG